MMAQIRKIAGWGAELEIWLVTAAVAASLVFVRLLPWAAVLIGVLWGIRWFARGRLSVHTPADWGIILLLGMVPVTLWATALPELTYPQVFRLWVGIGFFYAVVNWANTEARLRLLLLGVAGGALGLAVFATVSVEWAVDKLFFIPAAVYDRFLLLVADTVHRNVMAGTLVILFPFSGGVLLFNWRGMPAWQRLVFGVAALAVGGMIVLTQSRGAVLALGAVLLALVALRWRWGCLLIPLAVVCGFMLLQVYGASQVMDTVSSGVSVSGLDGRVEIWSRAIYMIQDFPFTGIGMGSFGPVADVLYPFFLFPPGQIPHAHNLYLQLAVDLGIPGLVGWLSVWLSVWVAGGWLFWRGRGIGSPWIMALGASLLCSQLALSLHGLVDAVTWGMVRTAPIVWALWGIGLASQNLYRMDKSLEQSDHQKHASDEISHP